MTRRSRSSKSALREGCTNTQPGRLLVPPGENTTVRVIYNTHGKQDGVTSKVIIRSNDPDRPEVHMPIEGFVKRVIKRTPLGGLVIRTTDGSPGQTSTVLLENQVDQPMKPRIKSTDMSMLDLEIREVTPGLTYEIVGRTKEHLDTVKVRGKILIETGLEREPVMEIGSRVEVKPILETVPAAMYFLKSDEKPQQRSITLSYFGDKPDFAITGSSCSTSGVAIDVAAARSVPQRSNKYAPTPKKRARATVSLPPPAQFPTEGIWIEFTTNEPKMPKIRVLATTDKPAFQRLMYGLTAAQYDELKRAKKN